MNTERALFPFKCRKSARNSSSNRSIFILFSVFNYLKLPLSYVKRTNESINNYSLGKQYNLISKKTLTNAERAFPL